MVLVTGSTGFLGSHLVCHLFTQNAAIRALRRDQTSFQILSRVCDFYQISYDDLKASIEWVDADIRDLYSLEEALEGIEDVYHLAGLVSFDPSDKLLLDNINVIGTANLVNLCLAKKVRKLCHVSSIAAIGRADDHILIDENVVWKNSKRNSNYAVSKYGGEREVWRSIEEGLDAVIVNPSIILGPGEINSGSTRLISTVEKGLKFYTPGTNGFIDVRDVVRIMVRLMEMPLSGERFILSAENLSYKSLFEMIAESLNTTAPRYEAKKWMAKIYWRIELMKSFFSGIKPLVTRETTQTSMSYYRYSNRKITDLLDYPFIPIQQSIAESCQYYLSKK